MTKTATILISMAMAAVLSACDAKATTNYVGSETQEWEPDPFPDPPVVPDGGGDASGDGGGGPAGICQLTFEPDCSGGPVPDQCNTLAADGTGSVSGSIVIPAAVSGGGGNDTLGTLVIALVPEFIFDACPDDPQPVPPVATASFHCADMRDGVPFEFTIEGVPPRPEAYQLIPFLDVNPSEDGIGSVDTCDLVSFPVQVTVDDAIAVTLDAPVEVSFSAAILETQCGLPACM